MKLFFSKQENPSEDEELNYLKDKFVSFTECESITEISDEKACTGEYKGKKILIRFLSDPSQFKKIANTMLRLESEYLTPLTHVSWEPKSLGSGYNYYLITPHAGKSLSDLFHEKPFSWSERLQIALNIARGLNFLHQNGVVHQQLRPFNILLDSKNQVRLANFISQEKKSFYGVSPYDSRYPDDIGQTADIFSFGMLLVALVIWKDPPAVKFNGKLSHDEHSLLKMVPPTFEKLIGLCLTSQLKHRPKTSNLVTLLEKNLNELYASKSMLFSVFTNDFTMPKVLINEISEYALLN